MKPVFRLSGWCVAWACALLSLGASPQALADDGFARRFALETDGDAPYYSVVLPPSIYTSSRRADLGDLRVLNGAGEAVPYSIDAPAEPARTAPTLREARWFALQLVAPGNRRPPSGVMIAGDGSLRATASPPPRAQHDTDLIDGGNAARAGRVSALIVHVRDDNYQGRVSVEASDDLRTWQPAGDAQLLKVSYNGGTLSQDRVELNPLHARYLRLRWLDGVPFVDTFETEVQAVAADHTARPDAGRDWHEGIVARTGAKPGEYFFESGGAYPVDRLRLNLPQPNTVAPAVVYSRAGLADPWREVAHATLFRLHNGDVEQTNPSLVLKPDTDRQWRVTIDPRDGGAGGLGGLGGGTLTVAAGWRAATLIFAAHGAGPFTLAVGNAAVVSAAVSRPGLGMGTSVMPAVARVGEALPVAPGAGAPLDALASKASRNYLMWGGLALAVMVLGGAGWWLMRRTLGRSRASVSAVGAAVASRATGTATEAASANAAANAAATATAASPEDVTHGAPATPDSSNSNAN